MSAVVLDQTIEQGATYLFTFWYLDLDEDPIDITGWICRMQLRTSQKADPLLSASSETGEFTIDGPAGKVVLRLSPTQTNSLSRAELLYDIELEDPDADDVYRIFKGTITVDPNITQDDPEVVVRG